MARSHVKWLAGVMAGAVMALLMSQLAGSSAFAQAPDPDDVAEGMRLYRTKGDCQSCHGWAADGRKMDTQMPDGANLRTTRLSRELLLMTIKCGRPGKGMPAFDRLAYSDGRCYNMKAADLKSKNLDTARSGGDAAAARDRDASLDFLFGQGGRTGADGPAPSASSTGARRSTSARSSVVRRSLQTEGLPTTVVCDLEACGSRR